MVDDALIFVGSFNLDARSAALNTEMGAFARHAALARQLRDEHERLVAPAMSYEVTLQGGELVWIDRASAAPRLLRSEPDASWLRRLLAAVIRWLPIESQL